MAQLTGIVGPQTADFVRSLLENATPSSGSLVASIISIVVLLAGASGIFLEVQNDLNTIWNVPKKQTRIILLTIKNRLLSFLMVLAIGVLFLVFLGLNSFLSGNQHVALPAAIFSGVMFLICFALYAFVNRVDSEARGTGQDR